MGIIPSMIFKKYKNIYFSVLAYILAALILFFWTNVGLELPKTIAWIGLIIVGLLIILGIYFGFKSVKAKESLLIGNLLMLLGILALLFPVYGRFLFAGY